MKQKDIALIIVIVAISAMLSFFVSRLVFATPKEHQQSIEIVDSISPDFATPTSKYFNSQSVDPTQLITIGSNTNNAPFNATTNQ